MVPLGRVFRLSFSLSMLFASLRVLVLFYQLLHTVPQLGSVFYRPVLNDAFRLWLQDMCDEAPIQEQRWLRALFSYYGVYDGVPKEYQEVAIMLDKTSSTVRDQVARGLRYFWKRTRARRGHVQELFDAALLVNEWSTADLSQEISLDYFEVVMAEDGTLSGTGRTPTAESREDLPPRPNLNQLDKREPNLYDEGVETVMRAEPHRIVMKDGAFSRV